MAIGADVITGVLTSIIYDGLKRPYKGIIDAFARKRTISRALTGSTSEAVDGAESRRVIADLVRVIAHDHDGYTEQLAKFLYEVERSAIPDTLKQLALCGLSSEPAYPAFELIYSTFAPFAFSSRVLFDGLFAAIQTRLAQATQDKVLFDALKAQSADLAARIEALAASLRNASTITEPITSQIYADLRVKAAKSIEHSNRTISIETNHGSKRFAIKNLIIPARLGPMSEKGKMHTPNRDSELEKHGVTYLNFRRTFNRAVILGDPGGGKSTLTQLLCHDLARQIGLENSTPYHHSFDSRDFKLPLRIILRTYEKRNQQNPSYSIFDYFIDELRSYFDNDACIATQFLKQTLIFGQAVLIFDGLDEILEVGPRRTIGVLIEQFANSYAGCPSLVTSRIVGYKDAPLSDEYQLYTLSRFNKDEVTKYADQLIGAVTSCKKAESALKASDFISQTNVNAEDLRENPLLLGLMVYIFIAKGEVPTNRPEIYKECSTLMFEKWDQRRDIIYKLPSGIDLLDLFGFLAGKIFGDAETEDGVSEEWLIAKLRMFFDEWYKDKSRSVDAAKTLVEFITGRAWVMCDIGPGVYKFTHRTFLEYFFARRIEAEAGGVGQLINNFLVSKILIAEWDVVSHLALQISTFRNSPKSILAVDALLAYARASESPPEQEINFLTFLARSVEYLSLPEPKLSEIIRHIYTRVKFLGAHSDLYAKEIVHELISSNKSSSAFIVSELVELVSADLAGGKSSERSFILYLIGSRFSGFKARHRSRYHEQAIWNAFEDVREKYRHDQYQRSLRDIEEARSYIYIYSDNIVELFSKYSLELLFCPVRALLPVEISACGYFLIMHCLQILAGNRGLIFDIQVNKASARELLANVASNLLNLYNSSPREAFADDILPPERIFLIEEYLRFFNIDGRPRSKNFMSQALYNKTFFIILVLLSAQIRAEKFRAQSPPEGRNLSNSVLAAIKNHAGQLTRDEFADACIRISSPLPSVE